MSSADSPRFAWSGGTIITVVFDVAGGVDIDVERHLAAGMAQD